MSTKSLVFFTINIVAGFSTGAYLVTHGFAAIGLLVLVFGFLCGLSIVGSEMKRMDGK